MAGDRDDSSEDGANLRRRRSARPHEDHEIYAGNGSDGVQPGVQDVSTGFFSSDEQPCRPERSRLIALRRNQDETTEVLETPVPESPLDTRAAAIMSGNEVAGAPIVGLPNGVASSNARAPPLNKASLPPKSSRRHRGLSLRSSLFTRNMAHHQVSEPSIRETQSLEMQQIGHARRLSGALLTGKMKAFHPSVTVSPVLQHDEIHFEPIHQSKWSESSRPTSWKELTADSGMPNYRQWKEAIADSALPNYQQWARKQTSARLPIKRVKDVYRRLRQYALGGPDLPPSKAGRQIPLNASQERALIDERTEMPYISNTIRSSRYTAWNFAPRQLFAQFSKLANFYFLTVSILQMIPGLSTTGMYTTIVPLLFFVSVSMAKEGYDDLRRYRLDKVENNKETRILYSSSTAVLCPDEEDFAVRKAGTDELDGPIQWKPTKWHALNVGDVVKLERDEAAPADLVLLRSSGPNNTAYVETMALDGETNLKNKQPSAALIGAYRTTEDIANRGALFVCEDPNLDLYNFEGRVTVNGQTGPLTNNEIIYRGSVLRNTQEAIAMVLYSGEECKIRMNANKNPRIKAPSIQTIVNKIVVFSVLLVLFLAFYNSIAYQIWHTSTEAQAWYLTQAHVSFGPLITSFVIMFNTLIPLSLYVALEIIKVAQMFLLNDVDMYDEVSNTPFEARTSTINEELGQISYIFSDKTGTLTENIMRFRKLSVAGTAWYHAVDDKDEMNADGSPVHSKRKSRSKGKYPQRNASQKPLIHKNTPEMSVNKPDGGADTVADPSGLLSPPKLTSRWSSAGVPNKAELSSREMIRYIQRRPNTEFARKAKILILSMALCHTCLPERDSKDDTKITYQASSPDELALVQAARELGYVAYDREVSTLTLKIYPNGTDAAPVYEKFEVLNVIEFSSKRKRMSVVVRFPDGRVCLMCKGADSIIMQKLRLAELAREKLAEVEQRAERRKSTEAHRALLKQSMQYDRRGSMASYHTANSQLPEPPRLSIPRNNFGGLAPMQDDVDWWLDEREDTIEAAPVDGRQYSPRPSAQYGLRPSMAPSEGAKSYTATDEPELVEESLVTDDAAVMERCFEHINDFATGGLRTLLYGHRFVDDNEYRSWKKVYHDASTSLTDRQKLIEEAGDMIEKNLELGGATAIEDKLQQGVPETIERLRRANIKMWMLTGDKRETAINVGKSCRLIKDYSSVIVLDHESGDVAQSIAAAIIDIDVNTVAHSVVVVDGQTLGYIDADESLQVLFLDLAVLADSVVCCRASPSQKAGLVAGIRKRVGKITLAIGDGANDIAMIQEAHVGIGITGKEGLQAARTSDYSIAQFRFLTKLLLVHGRWNYIRTCKYTVGTFWKEMMFYLTQALFQRYAGYTGNSLYETWSLSMFNTLFTSLVVIFLGIFEQDLSASTLIAVPELYTKGQRCGGFNFRVYISWMLMAVAEALIIFFTCWGLYGNALFATDQSLYPLGTLSFTACVVVIATKLQFLEQRNRTFLNVLVWIIAVGGWTVFSIGLAFGYNSTTNPQYYVRGALTSGFGRSALWWTTLLIAISSCLVLEITVRALKNAFFPTDVETFQTLESMPSVRRRFEQASASWLQAGRSRDTAKHSKGALQKTDEQARRDAQVQDLLNNRPKEEGWSQVKEQKNGVHTVEHAVAPDKWRSTRTWNLLSRFHGAVRGGTKTPRAFV